MIKMANNNEIPMILFFYNVNWSCNLYSRRKTCLNKWLVDTVWLITLYRLLPCCWWQSSKHHNCPVLISLRSVHITDKFSEKKISFVILFKRDYMTSLYEPSRNQSERKTSMPYSYGRKKRSKWTNKQFQTSNLRKIINFKQVLRNLIFVYWK